MNRRPTPPNPPSSPSDPTRRGFVRVALAGGLALSARAGAAAPGAAAPPPPEAEFRPENDYPYFGYDPGSAPEVS